MPSVDQTVRPIVRVMSRLSRGSRPPWPGTRVVATAAAAGLVVLTGCGSSLLSTKTSASGVGVTSTTAGTSTSTTVPVNGEVAVAFPVVACNDPAYGGVPIKSASGWNPTILVAPVPTSLVGKVTFYTDGVHTLLGPSGWTCSLVTPGTSDQSSTSTTTTTVGGYGTPTTTTTAPGDTSGQSAAIGARGATTLAVYPPNDPVPPTSGTPMAGAEGIFATYATTGTPAGVQLVCPFFAIPSWQSQSAGCSTTKPAGELTNALTPDVTAVADPAGVVGSLAASGGQTTVSGVVLFPQIPSAVSYGSPVAVAAESCSLEDAGLCATVVSDFEVREFPVPT